MSFNTNFDNIGGVTISSSYVASGFSSSKYLQLKEPWITGDYDTLEAVWAFTITSLSTNNKIVGRTNVHDGTTGGDRSISIDQSATSSLDIQLCSTGTTYDIGSITFTGIVANTKYWVKLTYADGVYTGQLSTDGFATVAQTYTINSTLKLRSGVKQLLGTYEGYDYGLNGTIDLLQCYFKINGATVWTPYSDNPGSVTVGKGLYKYNDGTEIYMTEAQTKGPDTLFDTKARKANLFVYRDSDGVSSFMASALTQPTASPEGKTLSAVQSLNTPIYLDATMDVIISNPTAVFTITPTPSTATVTINDVVQTSIEVAEGSSVTWSVAADGYVTQEGTETVTADTTKTVTLEEESTVVQPTLPEVN